VGGLKGGTNENKAYRRVSDEKDRLPQKRRGILISQLLVLEGKRGGLSGPTFATKGGEDGQAVRELTRQICEISHSGNLAPRGT